MKTRPSITPSRLARASRLVTVLTLAALLGACATKSAPPAVVKSPRIVERDLSGANESTTRTLP